MVSRMAAVVVVLVVCSTVGFAQSPPAFPAPKSVGRGEDFGRNLQRAMTLLADSTPRKRQTVKVLFYGQSITEQEWSREVAAELRRRFPQAHLIITNRAIGGFASQLLVKTAETDLYPFYPDLVIFHVYGSHLEYENIIRRTRERTTAEILIQTDHATKDTELTEETDPAKLTPKQWSAWMNYSFLPATAAKYHCGLVDQHNLWKQYLRENNLPTAQLLKDGVHLNAHGNYLMAELVKPHLVKRGDGHLDPMNCPTVHTHPVGPALGWQDGCLRTEFDGNRVDVVLKRAVTAAVSVRIDGRKPSEFPELYTLTRTTSYPGSIWPCLLRVTSEKPLQLEEWTLTIREASPDMKSFKFEVQGSKTGPDGEGTSAAKFVSRSGRVVIDPADWNFDYALKVFKRQLPPDFKVQWRVVPLFVDQNQPGDAPAPPLGVERVLTVAQGLPKGQHTVEIRSADAEAIEAIRIYRPPLW